MLKQILVVAIPIIAVLVLGSMLWQDTAIQSAGFPCVLTEGNAEGPYYIEDAPIKNSLGDSLEGQKLIISGKVLDRQCNPVPNAILDVWQTDANGLYYFDNFTLRGKIQADQNGVYEFETIFPGKYSESGTIRPAHIHVKVFSTLEEKESLTTQLYFAGDPDHDWLVKKSLILDFEVDNIRYANFNFIIMP